MRMWLLCTGTGRQIPPPPVPTYRQLLVLAVPIILSQVATAITGAVDTAMVGRFGTATDLAAVAVGAVVFNLVAWAFGFLRMATTGLTAQAVGRGDLPEARAVLARGWLLGAVAGVGISLVLPLVALSLGTVFGVTPEVASEGGRYLVARGLGAPAALMGFAVSGWLLGRGQTRSLLTFQLVLNGSNVLFDAVLVGGLGWGAQGVGLGTAAAQWLALGVGVWLCRDVFGPRAELRDRDALVAMFTANRDILVRTLFLVGGIAWFVRAGAAHGTDVVAGNEVLMQFISISALVLDAFAFLTEKEAGEAVGAGDGGRLRGVLWRTTVLAVGFGALFSLVYALVGPWVLDALVSDPGARASAKRFLPWCAAIPLVGVPAWQLDGLFLGATEGRSLRNAAIVATLAYVVLDRLLVPFGAPGLWWAFLCSYVLRAVALGVATPRLLRRLSAG